MYDKMEEANETGETNKLGSHMGFSLARWVDGSFILMDKNTLTLEAPQQCITRISCWLDQDPDFVCFSDTSLLQRHLKCTIALLHDKCDCNNRNGLY